MRWYSKLYMGSSLKKKSEYYKFIMEHRRRMTGIYTIALSSFPGGMLDIYHSELSKSDIFDVGDQLIVGLAGSRSESRELTGQILLDVLAANGNLDMASYFEEQV